MILRYNRGKPHFADPFSSSIFGAHAAFSYPANHIHGEHIKWMGARLKFKLIDEYFSE